MDTQKYRALLKVVDCGSITEAATQLGYTQSAVSRMVADLETRWGVTLLHRGKGGAHPTADARAVLPAIRAVCVAEDGLQSQVDAVKGLETGMLRIATFSSVATHWLPPVVKRLREDHPGITCELMMGAYSEIAGWVEEGRADCGFLGTKPPSTLNAWSVGRDQFMAVLPRDHKLAHLSAFPVEAFADEPFLQLETGVEHVLARINAETGAGIVPALSTFDDYAIMAMVEGGMGLAILSSLILNRVDYQVVALPLSIPMYREITLVTRRGPESAGMRAFRQHLDAFLGLRS
ncbi:MAG: LysR family transcriptional regulator [Eggerthellaceae bacterium]|nr:LysR family transcriptional regulator [Eggerthellaceae bacterium]